MIVRYEERSFDALITGEQAGLYQFGLLVVTISNADAAVARSAHLAEMARCRKAGV